MSYFGWSLFVIVALVILVRLGTPLPRDSASHKRRDSGYRSRRNAASRREQTLALDDRTLRSEQYGLVGRPDRIVRVGGVPIPEDWKTARTLQPWHRAQIGLYLLLVEEEYGVRPPYGVIETGDGQRHRIANTLELRQWVLDIADQIRRARGRIDEEIRVRPKEWLCRVCGQRSRCGQSRA